MQMKITMSTYMEVVSKMMAYMFPGSQNRTFDMARYNGAAKQYVFLHNRALKSGIALPDEIIAALYDDMNIASVIGFMNDYARTGQGQKLYVTMWAMGLLPHCEAAGVCCICKCTELKACVDKATGEACSWLLPDLCTACLKAEELAA